MNIGIVALGSRLGKSGGVDVHAWSLVNALADYDQSNSYAVIIDESAALDWSCRPWPPNVRFITIYTSEPPPSKLKTIEYGLRRLANKSLPIRHGESYVARQIDGLRLALLHYPSTVIYPLAVQTPCMLTFFDLQHEYYPQFFTAEELGARAQTFRPSVEKAVHLSVPSEYTRWTLQEKYGVVSSKISVVPVGLPPSFSPKESLEVERVRAKYHLPDSFIFYPANPWQHKNHARLMAALRIYRARYGDCPWLVLTGRLRGERRDAMSLAIAAGVEDRVLDLSFVESDDLPGLYSAAQVMVFPSLFEGFGIPLIEAMACGCPIVAANATAIPEITNGAALLFDPFDSDEIAQVVYRVLHNTCLRKDLIARGVAQRSRFSWQAVVSKLAEVYTQVVRELGVHNRLETGHRE